MHPPTGHLKLSWHSAACWATHENLFIMAETITAANSGDQKDVLENKGLMIDSTSLSLDLNLL